MGGNSWPAVLDGSEQCDMVSAHNTAIYTRLYKYRPEQNSSFGQHGAHRLVFSFPSLSRPPVGVHHRSCLSHVHAIPERRRQAADTGGSCSVQTVQLVCFDGGLQHFRYQHLDLRQEVRREPFLRAYHRERVWRRDTVLYASSNIRNPVARSSSLFTI